MSKWVALTIGTLLGGYGRYFLSGVAYRWFGTAFPFGTLAVNLIGCFFIGFLSVLAEEKSVLGPEARLCLMAGFCGAFTTFSTFMLETGGLVRDGQWLSVFLNIFLSVAAGFLAYQLGIFTARFL